MMTVEPFTVKDSLVIFVSVVARHQPRVRSVSVVFRGEDYTIRSSTRDSLTRHSTATKSGSPTKKIPPADASPANGMQ